MRRVSEFCACDAVACRAMNADLFRTILHYAGNGIWGGFVLLLLTETTVIITSSSDSKLQRAKSLGADFLINYRTDPAWEKAAMEITKDAGADIIFENVGARTLRQSFDCIAFGGLINCIGYLSGKEDDPGNRTSTNVLALRRNVTMKGLLNGPKKRFEDMLGLFEKREIESVVSRTFEFGEAREALGYLFKGGYLGRWLLWFLIMKRWNGFT